MSCSFQGCKEEIDSFCESCSDFTYFCGLHSFMHKKETSQMHRIKYIDQQDSKTMSLRFMRSQIERCIIQISSQTEEVIFALKQASNQAIKILKQQIKDMKTFSDFKPAVFNKERISFLINEAKLISEDLDNFTPNKMKELSQRIDEAEQTLQEKKETIAALEMKFQSLQLELNEKSLDLTQKFVVIESLQVEITKKKQEIDEKNGLLLERERTLNDIEELKKIIKLLELKAKQIKGPNYLEFQKLSLYYKKSHVSKNWPFIFINDECDVELLLTNDGKYLFRCNFCVDCSTYQACKQN